MENDKKPDFSIEFCAKASDQMQVKLGIGASRTGFKSFNLAFERIPQQNTLQGDGLDRLLDRRTYVQPGVIDAEIVE